MQSNTTVVISNGRTVSLVKSRQLKKKNNVESIHSIFYDASLCCIDPYWTDVLVNASKGIFLKGYRYDSENKTLSYTNRKKVHSLKISENPQEVFETFTSFCRSHGTFSEKDTQEEEEEELVTILEDLKWKKIKPRGTRVIHISRYITFLENKYDLNSLEKSDAFSVINCWLNSSSFNGNEIIMNKDCIEDIEVLEFDKNTRKFSINSNSLNKSIKKSSRRKLKEDSD